MRSHVLVQQVQLPEETTPSWWSFPLSLICCKCPFVDVGRRGLGVESYCAHTMMRFSVSTAPPLEGCEANVHTIWSEWEGDTKSCGNKVGKTEIIKSNNTPTGNPSDNWEGRREKTRRYRRSAAAKIARSYRAGCPCQYTERGGRLSEEFSAPRRRSSPTGAWGWGTGPGPREPGPSGRPGQLSSLPCWSRRAQGRWTPRPASVWHCCRRSAGIGGATPSRLPLCKVLWCQHHNSLEEKAHKQSIIPSPSRILVWLHRLTAPASVWWNSIMRSTDLC